MKCKTIQFPGQLTALDLKRALLRVEREQLQVHIACS